LKSFDLVINQLSAEMIKKVIRTAGIKAKKAAWKIYRCADQNEESKIQPISQRLDDPL
jgi:hypothetical protein